MVTTRRTLAPRADWADVVEAIYGSEVDDAAWASNIVETTRALLPSALLVGSYTATYDVHGDALSVPLATSPMLRDMFHQLKRFGMPNWDPFHFGVTVGTHREVARRLPPASAAPFVRTLNDQGLRDAIGVIAHPRPGLVTVLTAAFEHRVDLSRSERGALTRIALHLESGHRLRENKAAVIAEIDRAGNVREPELAAHVTRINEARSRAMRTLPEGSELWSALSAGRVSVVPRGKRYLVLDNPPSAHRLRALTLREVAVLSLAARGSSSKEICYALGISAALVSLSLQGAAAKVGVLSRTELIRLATVLTRSPMELLDDTNLTAAERDVLALVERGLDNRTIAAVRMRSVRTIANQVAALLRKTGTRSRRQLATRVMAR